MPVKVMTAEIRRKMATRAFNFGPPNSLKTTSALLTAYYPLQILSFPGETGWGTIPSDVPGLTSYVWEESPGDSVTAASIRREVNDVTLQILAGKNGPCKTLLLDGAHKLHTVYMDDVTAGAYSRGEKPSKHPGDGGTWELSMYGNAMRMFNKYFERVLASPIEYVIVTSWNAAELDKPLKPGDKARDVDSHEWPGLPGKLAKHMAGMFSLVVFSRVHAVPGKPGLLSGEWLLRPDTEVWGANVKMDPRLVAKLPMKVPQDWKNLYKVVAAAEQELEEEGGKS